MRVAVGQMPAQGVGAKKSAGPTQGMQEQEGALGLGPMLGHWEPLPELRASQGRRTVLGEHSIQK